jgi:hypothetical protein
MKQTPLPFLLSPISPPYVVHYLLYAFVCICLASKVKTDGSWGFRACDVEIKIQLQRHVIIMPSVGAGLAQPHRLFLEISTPEHRWAAQTGANVAGTTPNVGRQTCFTA